MTISTCFCLKVRESGGCGEFRGKANLVSLDNCNSDLSNHLSHHLGRKAISEGDLILARLGLFCTPGTQKRDMLICAKHRAHLGQYWLIPNELLIHWLILNACKHPCHKGGNWQWVQEDAVASPRDPATGMPGDVVTYVNKAPT